MYAVNRRGGAIRLLVWAVALTALGSCGAAFGQGTHYPGKYFPPVWTNFRGPTFAANQNLVTTYFFDWYDVRTGGHIVRPNGSDALTDHPDYSIPAPLPPGGYDVRPPAYYFSPPDFSSTDPEWYVRELERMYVAGIDFLLPTFAPWPDTAPYAAANVAERAAIEALDRALDLRDGRGWGSPRVGLFLGSLEFGHAQVNLASPQGKRLFYTAIRDAYSRLHPQRWARLNGRVLVWLWVEEGLGPYTPRGSLRPTFDYAKSRFAADFGGCRLIFIGSPGWRSQYNAPIDLTYEWGAARHSPGVITRNNPIVQIGPGFNYRGHTDTYADRQNGQRYWDGWVVALNSGRRIIAIETWNEFHEATEVCPSSEYEWFYWLITRRFAALHHRNPLPAPAYNPANGHCYEVVPIHINWFDADRLARTCVYQGRRGHLVTITSPEEQDFVLRTLGGPVALNEYWLGGFQGGGPEPAGGWQWVTREPWNYTCWFPGNPDDWMGAEHWVQFFGNTGLWNDIPALHIGRGLLVEYE